MEMGTVQILQEEILVLKKGGIYQLPESVTRGNKMPNPYMYWCCACNEILRTKDPCPPRCTNCGSPYWHGVAPAGPPIRVGRRQGRRTQQGAQHHPAKGGAAALKAP